MDHIAEIRILPPFAIARMGSSPTPMDNYELTKNPDSHGFRQLRPAATLKVNRKSGLIVDDDKPADVRFRDNSGRIRPIAPFFEVWVRLEGEQALVPLTNKILRRAKIRLSDLRWNVKVVNAKAFRRTGDADDRVEAEIRDLNHHRVSWLNGKNNHFLKDEKIVLGSVQFIRPSKRFPEIRLRFTPATGKVFGPKSGAANGGDGRIKEVYDPKDSKWAGHKDVTDNNPGSIERRQAPLPPMTYGSNDSDESLGYMDDTCDGLVEVCLDFRTKVLRACARILVGPPDFAPDSEHVRTLHDELEQAMLGPMVKAASGAKLDPDVRAILRRSVETLRFMNTTFWNGPDVGVARRDERTFQRINEPIFDPEIVGSLAVRSRHERVLLALESKSLAWFAGVLRRHDRVMNLSTGERRKMPALLRGSDGRHLTLTRRQINKVYAAANLVFLPDSRKVKK